MTGRQGTGIYLGAADWRHAEWNGVFYPADMPEEWQLAYYNTQFSCVWVPYACWAGTKIEVARQWREDTHEGFRFVLERSPAETEQDMAVQAALGDRIGKHCTIDDEDLIWFDAKTDLKELTGLIRNRPMNAETFLLSRNAELATLENVGTLIGLLGL